MQFLLLSNPVEPTHPFVKSGALFYYLPRLPVPECGPRSRTVRSINLPYDLGGRRQTILQQVTLYLPYALASPD